ncbi:MAG TPA: hypothetical protein VEY12_04940 [Thermoplasmata archaeon]|nr:hypothetical protein [Thermoplasmata archaeon]
MTQTYSAMLKGAKALTKELRELAEPDTPLQDEVTRIGKLVERHLLEELRARLGLRASAPGMRCKYRHPIVPGETRCRYHHPAAVGARGVA